MTKVVRFSAPGSGCPVTEKLLKVCDEFPGENGKRVLCSPITPIETTHIMAIETTLIIVGLFTGDFVPLKMEFSTE